jgi:hypothetical protein
VDNLLPGSSAKGYVGSYTLANLDYIEVFFYCSRDCNIIPTVVMDCIALRRGVKPYTLNQQFKEPARVTVGMYSRSKRYHKAPFNLRLRYHIRGSSFIRGSPLYTGNVEVEYGSSEGECGKMETRFGSFFQLFRSTAFGGDG